MADVTAPDVSKAAEPPKPVHIGGESFVDRILPHIKKILVVCVGVAIVAGVVFGVRAWKQRGEKQQTTRLAEVLETADHPLRGSGETLDPKKPSYADSKERAAAVLGSIAKAGTDKMGPAYRAALLVDSGKFDEAITEYKTCETALDLDGVICREGLGLALEAKAAANKDSAARQTGFDAALTAFKAMQPDDAGPRAAYAHYHQGRILLLLGKLDDAKVAFEKAKELGKDTMDLPELIEKRLATLGA